MFMLFYSSCICFYSQGLGLHQNFGLFAIQIHSEARNRKNSSTANRTNNLCEQIEPAQFEYVYVLNLPGLCT